MTDLFFQPYLDLQDNNGDPINGGKVYFYDTGTLNAATVYQDAARVTPHANPVVADSSGRAGPIYLAANTLYRVRITNAGGTLIKDVDPANDIFSASSLPSDPDDLAAIADALGIYSTPLASFATLAALTADSTIGYTGDRPVATGDIIEAGGFRYEVAASAASDHNLTTGGGVKLYVLPDSEGRYNPCMWGADPDATASANQTAFEACLAKIVATGAAQIVPAGTYSFDDSLHYVGGTMTYWDNVVMLKQHDGEGIRFGSSATTAFVYGDLRVQKGEGGSGPVANDGDFATAAGTATGDHGVVFCGRVIQVGIVEAMYTHDSGIVLEATANANHSEFSSIRGFRTGKYGIEATGTRDDNALWHVNFHTYGCWDSGIHLSDDYPIRGWSGLLYAEKNCQKETGDEFYAGKMTISDVMVYAENATAAVNEIHFAANCEWVNYYDVRANKTVIDATRASTIINTSRRTGLSTPVLSHYRATWVSPSNATRYARENVVETDVSGTATIMKEWRTKGDRLTFAGYDGSGLTEMFDIRYDGNAGVLGAGKGLFVTSPNGTRWYLVVDNSGALSTTSTAP